eukprot:1183190-Prorocentrum_minimum.AAC.1
MIASHRLRLSLERYWPELGARACAHGTRAAVPGAILASPGSGGASGEPSSGRPNVGPVDANGRVDEGRDDENASAVVRCHCRHAARVAIGSVPQLSRRVVPSREKRAHAGSFTRQTPDRLS